jgi:predicted GIY-YIG superfamily endonuclease
MERTRGPAATSRPAAVYRLWAEDGTLLYIGSAYDPEERCKAHHKRPWWPMVHTRTEKWYGDRWAAWAAEMEQIRREEPPHNVMGTSRYVAPDTPGMRRRNELSGIRARALRDADRIRREVWQAERYRLTERERFRLADLAYIGVLDACGAWDPRVVRLRAEHEARYGAAPRGGPAGS